VLPNLPRPPLPQTHSVSPLRPHPHQLLPPLPHHFPLVRQLGLNLPKRLKLHSLSALALLPLLRLLRPHQHSAHLLLPPLKSLLDSHSVNLLGRLHQLVVLSVVDLAPKLLNPHLHRHPLHSRLVQVEQAAVPSPSVVHLIRALDLVRNPPRLVSVKMAIPLLPPLRRLSVSDPVPQRHLLLRRTHSEVNLPNPVLSVSVQVLHPPPRLLLILSVLLSPLQLPLHLLHLLLEDSASTLAVPTMLQVHRLVSVTPHPLLLPLPHSVSASPMPLLRPRLPLLASPLEELVMVLQHLLNLHSALEIPHPLRTEVRPPLVSLKDSDLEVLRLGQRHLRMVDLVWVWTRVMHLVVPVEGRSSLSEGVRSVSKGLRCPDLGSRQKQLSSSYRGGVE
jgi:hypothetical protein